MFLLILSVIGVLASIFIIITKPKFIPEEYKKPVILTLLAISAICFASRSFYYVADDETAHFSDIYKGKNLPSDKILAPEGYKGPQMDIVGPGFHFSPFIKATTDVTTKKVINIPEGKYGFITALDGEPLREGQLIADEWPEDSENRLRGLSDASYFLNEMKGQKGPQLTIVPPGTHRYNHFLFKIETKDALDVETGTVAVIRSNVKTGNGKCAINAAQSTGITNGKAATPLVDKFCVGIWDEALPPKKYYLNEKAYVPKIIPTLLQTWSYKGGFTDRKITLSVSSEGEITQTETSKEIPIPEGAADSAIQVRVEGWSFYVEVRAVVQVTPADAPIVVSTVGSLSQVEDKIVTPAIRDALRTIAGQDKRKVLDFISQREAISKEVEEAVALEAKKAGVTLLELRLGEASIPPELMVAKLRHQLATQLEETYAQEKIAQRARIDVEKEKAKANQQNVLVKAEIKTLEAAERKKQLFLEGQGERLKLEEIAKGQKAQTSVLGEDRVLKLSMLKEILAVAKEQPDIIKIPYVNVQSAGQIEGAAAILGASNFRQLFDNQPENEKKK
ncbi:SPFH domain-containing protein [Pseudoalteromonas marina]|uniref:SPFH domain-containing protein n=1 Tax=Pseudoalteromonas marina TaxID=267375 RepID=A0ABT9FGD8_9GAMM|nr:SPFH domain-containing protein [Pseudoalteromonas marina]MDP2565847.1 SPFH domain-containing protein [Pseudoalteromonas marina]